jgi:predicted component of type VI protein secretion system
VIVHLTVLAPETGRGTFSLRLPFTAGRSADAKLRVQHERVSRRHCEFFEQDGVVFLRDLGSTNGTLVDDAPVDPEVPLALAPGAVVRLGHVAVRIDYDPFAEAPTAALDAATAARLGLSAGSGPADGSGVGIGGDGSPDETHSNHTDPDRSSADGAPADGAPADGATTDVELERFLRRLAAP